MRRPRMLRGRAASEPAVAVGDARYDNWETVNTFGDRDTALAWRDRLREVGIDAACVSDQPSTASAAATSTWSCRPSSGRAQKRSSRTSTERPGLTE